MFRSFLFAPGDRPERFDKAAGSGADAVCIDLEDAVSPPNKARARREKIACKECWCTTEVFLWPSFTYQPVHMLKTMLGGKVWRKPKPLDPKDKLVVKLEDAYGTTTEDGLKLAAVLAKEAEARAAEPRRSPVAPLPCGEALLRLAPPPPLTAWARSVSPARLASLPVSVASHAPQEARRRHHFVARPQASNPASPLV